MNPYTWKKANRAPFNILTHSWVAELHGLYHAGVLTLEQITGVITGSAHRSFDAISAFDGALTDQGTTKAQQDETEALISGEDPDAGPEVFSQPCFESLAVLMGMSVEDLDKITGSSPTTPQPVEDQGEDTLGETGKTQGRSGADGAGQQGHA